MELSGRRSKRGREGGGEEAPTKYLFRSILNMHNTHARYVKERGEEDRMR